MGRQYNVMEYITLGQAVIRGDLKGFEEVCNLMLQDFFFIVETFVVIVQTLRKHQKLFIYRGVYLVFEQVRLLISCFLMSPVTLVLISLQIKIIAYRNLVKKIYKISSSTRIRLDWILR